MVRDESALTFDSVIIWTTMEKVPSTPVAIKGVENGHDLIARREPSMVHGRHFTGSTRNPQAQTKTVKR